MSRRWGLGVGYVDAKTRVVRPPRRGSHASFRGVCQVIQDREAGERACQATALDTLAQCAERARGAGLSTAPFSITCHAGLTELVAPIVLDGEWFGALLCGGFFVDPGADSTAESADVDSNATRRAERLAVLDRRTRALALNPGEYRAARDRHPWLSAVEISFVGELLTAAAEEIALHHGEVLERWRRTTAVEREFATRYSYDAIIGRSEPMQELYSVLDRVVQSDSTVLIQGENGTGKELVARAIHFNSARKGRRFVVTNCSAFNDNLLDSELFGHKKGAFTGAVVDKRGLFEVADRGTFFLDEIGDMSPSLQVKVLRVLQEGTFTPVGDTETRQVDVRIIAATNRDLKSMVERGAFREDLYYRINVINLHIPPLRERREDIALLVEHFLEKQTKGGRARLKALSEVCVQRLLQYRWPGNVRELENEIERLVVLAGDDRVIDDELLSSRIRQHAPDDDDDAPLPRTYSLPTAMRNLERRMIREALERHGWNKTRASAELEVSRRNLIRLVQKHGLEAERKRG